MNLKRKKVLITSFILLDFILGGVVIGAKNVFGSTNSITKKEKLASNDWVEEVNIIGDGIFDSLGAQLISQEDLIVAQSIIMNNEKENMKRTDVLSRVVNTAKDTIASSKKTLANAADQQKIINTPVATKNGKAVVDFAMQFIGNPYVTGGNSLITGTDCSGFTRLVYAHFGVDLPRIANDQTKVGTEVSISAIQPGDLVFYSNGGDYATHVGIYIGDGKIVHASTPTYGICVNSISIMKRIHIRRVIN